MYKTTSVATRGSRYPSLNSGKTIFAVGDIHGCADLLDTLHAEIDQAATRICGPIVEIYLGDYVDRGPRSAGVIERLIRRGRGRELILLRGNHELLFQQAIRGALELREWARFGGLQTLESYGVYPADWQNGGDWHARLAERIPDAHVALLRDLSDSYTCEGYFFTHAGVRPGVPLEMQKPDDLLWIRRDFLDDQRDHGAVVVHGHTQVSEPELRRNRINLDTGAFISGRLTCLRIDREGARLFGGSAGLAGPFLAPTAFSSARHPALASVVVGSREKSFLSRARRAFESLALVPRPSKPESAEGI